MEIKKTERGVKVSREDESMEFSKKEVVQLYDEVEGYQKPLNKLLSAVMLAPITLFGIIAIFLFYAYSVGNPDTYMRVGLAIFLAINSYFIKEWVSLIHKMKKELNNPLMVVEPRPMTEEERELYEESIDELFDTTGNFVFHGQEDMKKITVNGIDFYYSENKVDIEAEALYPLIDEAVKVGKEKGYDNFIIDHNETKGYHIY